jgi:hypothetical protein
MLAFEVTGESTYEEEDDEKEEVDEDEEESERPWRVP